MEISTVYFCLGTLLSFHLFFRPFVLMQAFGVLIKWNYDGSINVASSGDLVFEPGCTTHKRAM